MEKHPLHLKNSELQTAPEVWRAVVRKERHVGKRVPNDPAARIEAYTDRLERIFLNPDEKKRERNLELFRDKIYDALIIKPTQIPQSYFDLQGDVVRQRGELEALKQSGVVIEEYDVLVDGRTIKKHHYRFPKSLKSQMIEVVIKDQTASLDAWIEYLASDDAVYPAWFKYFVWKNITKLSQFDKERGEFKKRTDSTVAPYPDIYREPLAKIADIYEQVKADNKSLNDSEIKEAFSKKFPSLYAELIQQSLAAQIENKEEVKGRWIKYEQGRKGDAEKLFESLDGKGTGWCTAGRGTAAQQVASGDFYVYYTNDATGNPKQPRVAIRMQGNQIGEVRGILPNQAMEPIMQDVLDTKLKEFGSEADVYRKKSADMKQVTLLEQKQSRNEPFTKLDLEFLYEMNAPIEGFGYGGKDPRIAELRAKRNPDADMLVVFECTREQIAHTPQEITENTKAYVGKLEPGIFKKLPDNLEHVYTSFPEKKIRRENVEIGGQDFKAMFEELDKKKIVCSDASGDMKWQNVQRVLEKIKDKNVSEETTRFLEMLVAKQINISKNAIFMLRSLSGGTREAATLIRLSVADLGFTTNAMTDQIYEQAQKLGLELCRPDVAMQYRFQYQSQPLDEWVTVGMKQISGSGGVPRVFYVLRYGVGLWLSSDWAGPGSEWDPDFTFVFRLRKFA